jgi:hypothetical protein
MTDARRGTMATSTTNYGIFLLEKYLSAFRYLINVKVFESDKSVKELLHLNTRDDWEFLCAAMDIIADASAAILHVQKFGLSGPTKYDDMGERYLRLYGLLSAIYIQQEAALQLYRIFGVGNYAAMKEQVEGLELRHLRHKIASHGVQYKNRRGGGIEAYVPHRFEIRNTTITAINYTSSKHEKIDLGEAIKAHMDLLISMLDATFEKSIKTLYKGQADKQGRHKVKLDDLRREKRGDVVLEMQGGQKFIITFVGNEPTGQQQVQPPPEPE